MGKAKSSVDLASISLVVKKAAKGWIKEALATNEATGHFGSSEDLNERVAEVLMKEHNGKGPDFVKQKLDETKPQIDFVVSLFNYINPCPLEDQPIRASIAKWCDSAFDALVRHASAKV